MAPPVRLKWPHMRCILCLSETALMDEHIIPGYLGGRLQVDFLCRPCNSTMGTREADWKEDPRIRLAAEYLGPVIPEIADSVADGQTYFVESEAGRVRGIVKGKSFRISATRGPDDSLIQPTPLARKTLAA